MVESQQIGFLPESPKILANNGKKAASPEEKSLTSDFGGDWYLKNLFGYNKNLNETRYTADMDRWYLEEVFWEAEDDFGIDTLFDAANSSDVVECNEDYMPSLGSLFDF